MKFVIQSQERLAFSGSQILIPRICVRRPLSGKSLWSDHSVLDESLNPWTERWPSLTVVGSLQWKVHPKSILFHAWFGLRKGFGWHLLSMPPARKKAKLSLSGPPSGDGLAFAVAGPCSLSSVTPLQKDVASCIELMCVGCASIGFLVFTSLVFDCKWHMISLYPLGASFLMGLTLPVAFSAHIGVQVQSATRCSIPARGWWLRRLYRGKSGFACAQWTWCFPLPPVRWRNIYGDGAACSGKSMWMALPRKCRALPFCRAHWLQWPSGASTGLYFFGGRQLTLNPSSPVLFFRNRQ